MAKKKKGGATTNKKKGRKKNTLNASVGKKLGIMGALVGAGTIVVPAMARAVQSKSIAPMSSMATVATGTEVAKRGVIGYISGRGAGFVIDKFAKPLKRPLNKIMKMVGVR